MDKKAYLYLLTQKLILLRRQSIKEKLSFHRIIIKFIFTWQLIKSACYLSRKNQVQKHLGTSTLLTSWKCTSFLQHSWNYGNFCILLWKHDQNMNFLNYLFIIKKHQKFIINLSKIPVLYSVKQRILLPSIDEFSYI